MPTDRPEDALAAADDPSAEELAANDAVTWGPQPPRTEAGRQLLRDLAAERPGESWKSIVSWVHVAVLAIEDEAAGWSLTRTDEVERAVLADVLRCLDVAHEAWREAHKNGGGWFFAGADGPFDTTVGESRRRLRAALAPRDEEAGNG